VMGSGLILRKNSVYRQLNGRSKRSALIGTVPPRQHHRPQHRHRHHVFFSSQTAYQDPTLRWAQSNPGMAQECLKPPPRINSASSSIINHLESLDTYLEWRKWAFPNEINDQSAGKAFGDPKEKAKSLISHLLSAPLTLSSHIKAITKHSAYKNTGDDNMVFDWCCVGARAEATIPLVYWNEFLMSSRKSLSSNESRSAGSSSLTSNENIEITLDFVGPDIPPKLPEQSVIIPSTPDEEPFPITSLCLRGYHNGYFHDIPAIKEWDAYVFFNPGFGHPNLRKSWESTLKLVLDRGRESTNETPRSLLLTAHSEHDMARDAAILSNIYGLRDVVYHENPFASRVVYEDPFEKNHFVRPNHYVANIVI